MLGFFFFNYDFFIFCQSGFYLDFFFKKFAEVFIKNLLIYSALFLGEKFLIEYLTKIIFEKFFKLFFKYFGKLNFSYKFFFINIICIFIIIYILLFIFIYFI